MPLDNERETALRHWKIHSPALAALLWIAMPGSSIAYELFGADWTHMGKPMGEDFVICTQGAPDGAASVIRKAAATWDYTRFRFTFATERCLADPSRKDEVNYIDFGPIQDPGETAFALKRNEGKRLLECDIRFSSARKWHIGSGAPGSDQNDLFSVALHELGHCLGLEHSKVDGSVMAKQLDKGKHLRSLQPDDVAGRNKLYGTP